MYTENVNRKWKFIVSKRERAELLLQIIADSTDWDFVNQNEWSNTAVQQTVQGINELLFFFLGNYRHIESVLKVNKATQTESPSVRNLSNIFHSIIENHVTIRKVQTSFFKKEEEEEEVGLNSKTQNVIIT